MSNERSNLIVASNLTKTFNGQTAVDQVSLNVARGEVVGFLGPNGAGKSTTMRMITGFLEPDSGTASICGHDVRTAPIEAKSHLGYLPEGAPAYGDMTVADFLHFVADVRGLAGGQREERLGEMVARIHLDEVWNKPVETLSKGFKRRVGIAQALVHDPDVLVLDEPTDGLDPNQKHEMRSLIRDLAPQKAIVVSTHILEEVEAICSRAIIIASGKVVADATPEALVAGAARDRAIRVTIASAAPDLVEQVTPLTGGGKVEVIDRFNGSTRLMVEPGSAQTEPDTLARDLRQANFVVDDVGPHHPRLEDVFRQITSSHGMS